VSLLLLLGGAGITTVTPLSTDGELLLFVPDEVASGATIRLWAELSDNVAAYAPTTDIQIRIIRLDSSGIRQSELPLQYMTAQGEGYYTDWTPTQSGTFVITVAAHDGGKHLFEHQTISARPKFDPVALALSDVLVSRM
jgi:hypothetical protein